MFDPIKLMNMLKKANDFKQKVMSRFSPLRRRFPAWPFYYRSKDQDIQEKLELSDTWDPCLFDGDASLW